MTRFDPSNTFPAEITGVQLVRDGTPILPYLTTTINGTIYDYTQYNDYAPLNPPIDVGNNSVNLYISPGYLTKIKADSYTDIKINYRFNSSNKLSIPYDYSTSASPTFIPAILEVRIW